MVLNHWSCVISCLWQSETLQQLSECMYCKCICQSMHLTYSVRPPVLDFSPWLPRPEKSCSCHLFSEMLLSPCVINTVIMAGFTSACAGECMWCWHLVRHPTFCHSDLTWIYIILTHASRRGFETGYLANCYLANHASRKCRLQILISKKNPKNSQKAELQMSEKEWTNKG